MNKIKRIIPLILFASIAFTAFSQSLQSHINEKTKEIASDQYSDMCRSVAMKGGHVFCYDDYDCYLIAEADVADSVSYNISITFHSAAPLWIRKGNQLIFKTDKGDVTLIQDWSEFTDPMYLFDCYHIATNYGITKDQIDKLSSGLNEILVEARKSKSQKNTEFIKMKPIDSNSSWILESFNSLNRYLKGYPPE